MIRLFLCFFSILSIVSVAELVSLESERSLSVQSLGGRLGFDRENRLVRPAIAQPFNKESRWGHYRSGDYHPWHPLYRPSSRYEHEGEYYLSPTSDYNPDFNPGGDTMGEQLYDSYHRVKRSNSPERAPVYIPRVEYTSVVSSPILKATPVENGTLLYLGNGMGFSVAGSLKDTPGESVAVHYVTGENARGYEDLYRLTVNGRQYWGRRFK